MVAARIVRCYLVTIRKRGAGGAGLILICGYTGGEESRIQEVFLLIKELGKRSSAKEYYLLILGVRLLIEIDGGSAAGTALWEDWSEPPEARHCRAPTYNQPVVIFVVFLCH